MTNPPAAVYSLERLIDEARRLAAEYRRATGRPLPGVSSEIAEHDAARLLGLVLCEDRSQGIDALGQGDRDGLRYQIKGRVLFGEKRGTQRIGELKLDKPWDRLALVLLDDAYQPMEIYEADRSEVEAALAESEGSSRRNRGALSVARFRHLARLAWAPGGGADPELWDNRSAG